MSVAEGRPLRRLGRTIRRAIARVTTAVREFNYWQQRSAVLSMSLDRYANAPDRVPDTYEEFLGRTAGPLLREPSSRARLSGQPVG
jgi:hypothetical protein